jgi:hypothetical protein
MEIASTAQRRPEIGQIDFPVWAVHRHDPKSLVQETRSIAFVRFNV